VVETGDYDVSVGASAADLRGSVVLAVQGETVPDRDLAAAARPAVNFDDYSGVTLVDTSKAAGTSVSATASGQWVSYQRVSLGGATGLVARVSRAASGPTTVGVRLGSPTGTLAGTLTVPSTGDRYSFTTAIAALTGTSGTQDVYLVFGGAAQLDPIQLTGGSTATTTTSTTTTGPTTTTTTTRPTTTTTRPTTTTTRPTTTTTRPTTTTGAATGSCAASYAVTGQWPGGFQAEVTVRNPGTSALSGWTVTWTYANGQTITSLWSGAFTQSGAAVTVTNAAWNGALAPAAGTTFGFTGNAPGASEIPALSCR
jgi:cellulase/cellobiase CelA1